MVGLKGLPLADIVPIMAYVWPLHRNKLNLLKQETAMKCLRPTTALLALALAIGAGQADAHSKKEATEPADGSVITASPEAISMTFDMPLRVTLITLLDQTGAEHALTRSDNMQPVSDFTAQPPELPAGQYKIIWRGLAADGHPMQGEFGFEVSQ